MVRLSSQSIALLQLMLDTLIKSVVILSAAGLGARSLRRASASSRHLVWSVAMASLLALPALSIALPSWRIAALPSLATLVNASADVSVSDGSREPAAFGAVAAAPESERGREPEARLRAQRQSLDVGTESPASNLTSPLFHAASNSVAPSRNDFDWKIALSLAWLTGAFVVMARMAVGTARVWLLTRRAQGVESSWIFLARTLATRLRLRRRVRIFKTDRISMPMTWGLMRSAVLLPKESDEWSTECRWIVMAHELTHVKRRDCLMQALAQLACAVYWFNPLVWFAAWRLRVERELACDDHVLETGAKASDYASHLVEIASSFGAANCGSPVAVGMACSHLESRVRSILDPNARRRGVNGLKVALAAVIAAVLTAPLAMLQPWRSAEASARKDHASVNSVNPSNPTFAANLFEQDQDGRDKAREAEESQKQIGDGDGVGQGTGQGQGQGAGQGQGKSGEMTVEQLIEMKAVGVTPEYIESIRKLGYSELTIKQAVELRSLGVDEEFVKQSRGWTNGNPSIEELVELKSIGMSADFINGMKQAGYNNLTIEQLVELKAVGVNQEFIESMRRAGFDKLTADELTELKSMGVNESFVKEAQGWGFGNLSKDDLVEIKAMGISPEYARSMKALGFDNLSLKQLIEVKSVGVNADFIKEMRELGFDKLTLDQLVEMKSMGITADYVKKMRAAGLKNVSINELIELKATGVDKIITREKR
ncbi:MAG TPA: M56 family metallopeptidase [Blastocatellia bacterium]|jgi:beta-lactamase regulating signal transducer with metallopeptidase domain|nr:M56 family metallopeptidase [Blastocatellia bacterium]